MTFRASRGWRACAAALLASSSAGAQSPDVQLEWNAPPSCPDASAVRARAHALRAPAPEGTTPRPVRARATVVHADEWRLQLQTETAAGTGERTLTGASCEEVAEAAALILALASGASDPTPSPPESPAAPPPVSAPPPVTPPVTPPDPVAPPPRRRAPSLRLFVRADVVVDVGSLPSASPGASVALGVAYARWRFELAGSALASQRAEVVAGVGGDIGLVAGALRGCFAVTQGRVAFDACAGVEGAWMSGQGVGLPDARSEGGMRWSARAGVAAGWRVTPSVRLRGALEPGFTVSAPTFVVTNAGVVHEPSSLFMQLLVGLEAGD